ncbi:SDR family NAD(P)-dependent oxidoreductase [Devosia sp.]|uniref:SDR family NAD(P)-dependent oxidoreductase n=1 Tax=Devosia sp. TaxID=1871048 RepID=UPI003A9149EE
MTYDFSGKVALVTGGASGIGEAVSKLLAASGAKVVVADLDESAAKATAAEIEKAGGTAAGFAVDVADAAQNEAMVAFAKETYGGLHLAVNNAGIGGAAALTGEYPIESWDKVIDINLNGVFYGMRYEIPAIEASGGGSIVNMASILGSVGIAMSPAYVAAKHGVVGLTKSAALEYGEKGVRINAIGPGFIETPLLTKHMDEETLKFIASKHAMNRLGQPEEIANLTAFLLSDEAGFITGSYHLADGGYVSQ